MYTEISDNKIIFWCISYRHARDDHTKISGYNVIKYAELNTKTLQYSRFSDSYYGYNQFNGRALTEKQMLSRMADFVEIDAILENGTKVRIKDDYSLTD